MKRFASIAFGIIVVAVVAVSIFTFDQATKQRDALMDDLERRTSLLADSFKESIRTPYMSNATSTVQSILNKFAGRERILGLAVYDNKGMLFATTPELPEGLADDTKIHEKAMDANTPEGEIRDVSGRKVYVFSAPLRQDGSVVGALAVFQRADYIDVALNEIWQNNFLRLVVVMLVILIVMVTMFRLVIYRPIQKMAQFVRDTRIGKINKNTGGDNNSSLFNPIADEVFKMSQNLVQARKVASEEARLRLEKLDSPWTAERLKEFFKARLKGRQIFVISNREPYIHKNIKDLAQYVVPASGMITALEPVMEACGGTWLAHGSGEADAKVVDTNDEIKVPPDDPKYTLKRIWLTEKEIAGHYVGFSNEALWPLCHLAHTRPTFRKEDWVEYRKVNGKFAEALLSKIKDVSNPIILVQDYHFALLPRMIKDSRPDAEIGIFWHIPWPSAESFSICPWRKEILDGMLGADVVGFHTQQYCNNFFETVGKEIESLSNLEKFAVTHAGHTSYIKPFPISVPFTASQEKLPDEKKDVVKRANIQTKRFGLGVDRMDYTKGILERLKGIEFFFDKYPSFKKQFTFLQIAPPSRQKVEKYREFDKEVTEEVERINQKFSSGSWQPIVLSKQHHTHERLYSLYRAADLCLVTSLSDGMNLVAKEFVAARNDDAGVLILSQFTGAARDLQGALTINPYSAEETAEAIHGALSMSKTEQHKRMKKMRDAIGNYNIYRWAVEFLRAITSVG